MGSVPHVVMLAFLLAGPALLATGCPGGEGEGEGDGFVRGMTWQITLQTPPTTRNHDVEVWDLDLEDTPADTIALLQAGGTRVICYFSAGTWEPFRSDAAAFPAEALGNGYEDPAFAEERYVDINNPAVFTLMAARLDVARDKGCDAVDPDNVDLPEHDTGFAISAAQMESYNLALVEAAHARGMAVGLKNSIEALPAVGDSYDFFVNEECAQFDECDAYADVLAANKPVFHIEYVAPSDAICATSARLGLSTVFKSYDLDDPLAVCP